MLPLMSFSLKQTLPLSVFKTVKGDILVNWLPLGEVFIATSFGWLTRVFNTPSFDFLLNVSNFIVTNMSTFQLLLFTKAIPFFNFFLLSLL